MENRIEYVEITWSRLMFTEWINALDPNWWYDTIHDTRRYIANKEIVAIKKVNKITGIKKVMIRSDLLCLTKKK